MKKIQSQPVSIAPTLRLLKVGQVKNFPLNQYSSVKATIQRIQTETDRQFSTKKNEQFLEVTRKS